MGRAEVGEVIDLGGAGCVNGGDAYIGEGVSAIIEVKVYDTVGNFGEGDKGEADGQDSPAAAVGDYFEDFGASDGIGAGDGSDAAVGVLDGWGDIQG